MPSPESSSLESNVLGVTEPIYEEKAPPHRSLARRVVDSFKRDPNARATSAGVVGANGNVFDVEAAAQATANSPLARKLKGRHLQMIAIGGSIGTEYLVHSLIFVLISRQVLVYSSLLEKPCPTAVRHQC